MQYLREAAQDVQRNLAAFLLYAAIFAVAHTLSELALLPFHPGKGEEPLQTFRLIEVLIFLLFIHAIAFAQTIAFSRLGRDIDRPLWKVRTDGDALKRFFMMWALFNLTSNGLLHLSNSDFGGGDAIAINTLLLYAGFAALMVCVPFGACIMFTGRVSSRTIGESLAPLGRQPGRTGTVFALVLLQMLAVFLFALVLAGNDAQQPSLAARLVIPLVSGAVQVYLECLAFAATWHLCMVDRETVDEIDLDF